MRRFISESDEKNQKDTLHTYEETEKAMKRYEAVLNDLYVEIYAIEINDKIPDNCNYTVTLIQAAQNQTQTNTGGLAQLLKLKIGAELLSTITVDIQDCLINHETRIIRHIEFVQVSVRKVYVNFSDEQAGSEAIR